MSVDETFRSINRIWEEISVIVVVHAVAIGLGIYSLLIPERLVTQGVRDLASLPELTVFRENLTHIGLDLPLVVGAAIVVYVVLFQRLSAAAIRIPGFKLVYSQPALWRAGKCFDDLRQLALWFEGYTASAGLTDLEVTLGLAITESAKDYKQHYTDLVDSRFVSAALWARYYSGFCLIAFASILFILARHPTKRGLLLPIGLLASALIARVGWEAQIERGVLGRLRFAIDCGIVSGAKRREGSGSAEVLPQFGALGTAWTATERSPQNEALELELASECVRLPPPFLPYQHFWALHYVRALWPFKDAGCLPLMHNYVFRQWLHASGVSLYEAASREERGEGVSLYEAASREEKRRENDRRRYGLLESIASPAWVPDDRLIVRLLRRCVYLAKWPFPGLFLVDEVRRYPNPGSDRRLAPPPGKQPLRDWSARRRGY